MPSRFSSSMSARRRGVALGTPCRGTGRSQSLRETMCFERSWKPANSLFHCGLEGQRKSQPPSRQLCSDGGLRRMAVIVTRETGCRTRPQNRGGRALGLRFRAVVMGPEPRRRRSQAQQSHIPVLEPRHSDTLRVVSPCSRPNLLLALRYLVAADS